MLWFTLELIHRDFTTIYTLYDLHLSWYTEISPRYIHIMIYTSVDTLRCHHDTRYDLHFSWYKGMSPRYMLWFTLKLKHKRCHHDKYTLWFIFELIHRDVTTTETRYDLHFNWYRDVTTIYTRCDSCLNWYTEMSPRYIHIMIYT